MKPLKRVHKPVSLILTALAVSHSLWWTGSEALAMYLMFRFVSVPWMEKKY